MIGYKKLELCFREGILFVEPGTGDKVLCLQCNVRCYVHDCNCIFWCLIGPVTP